MYKRMGNAVNMYKTVTGKTTKYYANANTQWTQVSPGKSLVTPAVRKAHLFLTAYKPCWFRQSAACRPSAKTRRWSSPCPPAWCRWEGGPGPRSPGAAGSLPRHAGPPASRLASWNAASTRCCSLWCRCSWTANQIASPVENRLNKSKFNTRKEGKCRREEGEFHKIRGGGWGGGSLKVHLQ